MTVSRIALNFSFCLIVLLTTSLHSSLSQAQEWVYTTVEGDNLWNLSEKHLDRVTRFQQLQKLNNIKNPRQLQPGTRLRVPLKWIRSNPVPAEISELRGEAELLRAADNSVIPLTEGSQIQLGDRIRSGADTTLAIRFADNTVLTLYSDSLIRFDHLSAHGTTGMVDSRLNLLKGRMDTRVTPASGPGSRFEIETPSAISAVRGTEYRATVADEGQLSNIEVLHGKVVVSGADKKRLIKAGYGTQIATGTAPIPPKKLLPPPPFKKPDGPIRSINWIINWQTNEDAREYRIEVSEDASFNTLLWQQISEYSRAPLPDLPDGKYFARVRGIDQLGLEGQSSVLAFTLDARPQPPVQLSPADKKLLRGQSPELQWTASEDAARYHLEIATDATFNNLIVDDKGISGNRYDSSALPVPGNYFWRLTSVTADNEFGPAGLIREWETKPIPAKVDAQMSASEDGMLVASWPSTNDRETYQVQLAYDKAFNNIQTDSILTKPEMSFQPVKNTPRYLRVRTIATDGYIGPWGATQKVVPVTDYTPVAIWGSIMLLILL
ncbi:FecR domain-containing protein [Amphritea japonica]|uniref:Peptidoglycan-binding protein n=1 Tax=Amphritea japonica ATCC BAA-1530 TaxID=1278309 RepID=A0A7R6ST87_9GAMM|nr:FecR domain-containing protein [Amphritea japonica]BBB27061.1 peptidoglycan-binding protein [Amphritea japonica ATCC BAA-1530]